MKALPDASRGSLLAHFVVFIGCAFHVVHGGLFGTVETGHEHLREAEILSPRNSTGLIFSQLFHAEVRADAGHSPIVQHFLEFGTLVFGEAAKPGVLVAYRRTELDVLKSRRRELFDCAWEVFGDAFSHWPGLATERQSKRIGMQFERASAEEAGRGSS